MCHITAQTKVNSILFILITRYIVLLIFLASFLFIELLLVAIPAKRVTLQDAKFKLCTIVRCLEFTEKTLSRAFFTKRSTQTKHSNAEHRNFTIDDICSVIKLLFSLSHPWSTRFENILQEPHYVALPKEGQLRIDDALNEMEAMDYREWNDEPLKSQREFYILGSALYFRKYLLASHLSKSDTLDIEAFLRINGIYLLIENKPVRELIVWREIYPNSFFSITNHNVQRNQSRWFLTIVARNQLFMAVILESRHRIDPTEPSSSSSSSSGYIGPSRFYIDEIQDTLDHLQANGIENLASTWLHANKRPEVCTDKWKIALKLINFDLFLDFAVERGIGCSKCCCFNGWCAWCRCFESWHDTINEYQC